MKTINFTIAFVFLLLMLVSCTKKQENAQNAYVGTTIGTAQFTSSGVNVNVGEDSLSQGGTLGGEEQVTITAESDASTGSDKDYLVIAFGYKQGDIKSYSVQNKEAIGAYHKSGSNGDDIAISGTVTITDNVGLDGSLGKHLNGTFNFTTQKGLNISSGTFGVQVNY